MQALRQVPLRGGLAGELGGITRPQWFRTTTARIDAMRIVEEEMASELDRITGDLQRVVQGVVERLAFRPAVERDEQGVAVVGIGFARTLVGPGRAGGGDRSLRRFGPLGMTE